jgi:hypothetical protein
MTAERRSEAPKPHTQARPLTAGRIIIRVAATIAGIIGGLFCYFVCQGMFAGYPRYRTDLLSWIGMLVIMAVGAAAWIVDHRRIDRDDDK